ncbi:hypothetical protein [Methylacidimicrobium sp. AP8]|uniref:hypothetical protein n=1 Tax=Methylacidimicrobium sp. AP8 TaxID=2730359 RepID=UPI001920AE71|nr:hypothetical protein [Methylacidimicrobium sp. AP8]
MKRRLILIATCVLLGHIDCFAKLAHGATRSREATPTAFSALAVARQYAPEGSQGKMLAIIGPRSPTALTPTAWEFLYWNPGGWKHIKRVTVIGGQVRDVREEAVEIGWRGIIGYKESEAFNPSELKVDSDRALQVILKTGAAGKARLSSVLFALERRGSDTEPVWEMRFYADRRGFEADIGVARVGAVSGKILELRLKPERATGAT